MNSDVEYLEYMWPMRHFLITCGDNLGASNIIAISFCMPVSKTPPMLACAIGKAMYSCELIEQTGEFVVNVPPKELKPQIYYCGFHSGRHVNKFQETGLTPQPARSVSAPIIEECVAFIECVVEQRIDAGDKRVFIGKVIEAYADKTLVSGQRTLDYAMGEFPRKIYGTRFK
jgi:flavin reductase (DIM6/NTAB) family NADH-FMN oxidoreductase RutF